MNADLQRRSNAALMQAAIKAAPRGSVYEFGYTARWKNNLMRGLPFDEIECDFTEGATRELPKKLAGAHSSVAIVVNTFGPWRGDPTKLAVLGATRFYDARFDIARKTPLGGTPPRLHFVAEGNIVVAVESNCTEWMKPSPAEFSPSYSTVDSTERDKPWFDEMHHLHDTPDTYKFLDAAVLVKHAFGLLHSYPGQVVRLLYLFWEPLNAGSWPQCRAHRAEADALAERVQKSSVRLIPMPYRDLWAEWKRKTSSAHLKYLRARYNVEVRR